MPCSRSTRACRRTPCGCGSSRPARWPEASTSRTSSTPPTPARSPCSRSSAAGSPGWRPPSCWSTTGRRWPSWSPTTTADAGSGSLLLEHLAALGREHGVTRFEAEVLADNYGMLRRLPRRGLRGVAPDGGRRGLRRAAHRRLGGGPRRRRPAGVAFRGPFAAAAAAPASVAVVGVRRTPVGWAARCSTRSARAATPAGCRSCTRRPTPWPACRRTAPWPPSRSPSTSSSWWCPPPRRRGDGRRLRRGCGRGHRRLVGLHRRGRPLRRARAARAGPGPQRPGRRPELAGRAVPRRREHPEHHVCPGRAADRWAGGRLAVGRRRLHAARPGRRPRGRRALLRLAGRQARRVEQRPAGGLG